MGWEAPFYAKTYAKRGIVMGGLDDSLRLPRLISNGMILQREQPIKIWGWAKPGTAVTVKFLEREHTALAGADGAWAVVLPSAQAGGPHSMEVRTEGEVQVVTDILVGDVWLCSGQSNMQLPMERVDLMFPQEIAEANNPLIREFKVPERFDFHGPQNDLEGGTWTAANPETVRSFSAVGYFFAKALFERYRVPIGLVDASIGGTPVQAWMSREALAPYPEYLEEADMCANDSYVRKVQAKDQAAQEEWHRRLREGDQGLNSRPRWYDRAFTPTGDWQSVEIPFKWQDVPELAGLIGSVWFRKVFYVPESLGGKPGLLLLGAIVDSDATYLNGRLVGSTGYKYPPRKYSIPLGVLQPGANLLVVRAMSHTGEGEFVPEKPYQLVVGDEIIDLDGPWQYKVGGVAEEPLPPITFFIYKPVGLYNGMIAPLTSYALKGVIWYQGESNTGNPGNYCDLFSRLITDWRTRWQRPDLPFLYVQLANYMPAAELPSESNWAELRHQQLLALANPHTAMATAVDVGEWNDLHPLNKKAVGERLALGARAVAYGEDITYSGPIYKSMEVQGNKIILSFDHVDGGLESRGGPLKHFAIAGCDGTFRWANAEIVGDKVAVWHEGVPEPRAVRYAWADNPAGANLYNKAGLPASPFRTD